MSEQTKRYPASVFWSESDGGFIALATDLPGCSAFGESADEALRELEPAMEAWLEAAASAGNPIPQPSQPPTEPQLSGKVLLRMPRDLHTRLARMAEAQGVSLNQYLVYLLATRMPEQHLSYLDAIGSLGAKIWPPLPGPDFVEVAARSDVERHDLLREQLLKSLYGGGLINPQTVNPLPVIADTYVCWAKSTVPGALIENLHASHRAYEDVFSVQTDKPPKQVRRSTPSQRTKQDG